MAGIAAATYAMPAEAGGRLGPSPGIKLATPEPLALSGGGNTSPSASVATQALSSGPAPSSILFLREAGVAAMLPMQWDPRCCVARAVMTTAKSCADALTMHVYVAGGAAMLSMGFLWVEMLRVVSPGP